MRDSKQKQTAKADRATRAKQAPRTAKVEETAAGPGAGHTKSSVHAPPSGAISSRASGHSDARGRGRGQAKEPRQAAAGEPQAGRSSNNGLGRYGEEVAARRLAADGLRILERNWRCAEGELDIVALDGDTLAVCEVKTRSERSFQQPTEAIDQAKADRLCRLAERWLGERWPTHFAELATGVGGSSALPAALMPWPAPTPPGGVRIDLIAVINKVRGAAVVEHFRGVI